MWLSGELAFVIESKASKSKPFTSSPDRFYKDRHRKRGGPCSGFIDKHRESDILWTLAGVLALGHFSPAQS